MKGLRYILPDSVKDAGGSHRAEEQQCVEIWAPVVGEKIAEATRAERLRDGTLTVLTRSSVWACELTFVKEKIIHSLNEGLGRQIVRDIRFKVGPFKPIELKHVKEDSPQLTAPTSVPANAALTARARAQVERALSAIRDDQLREHSRPMLERAVQLREQRQRSGWQECRRCGALHPEGHRLCPLCRLHIRT